MMNLIVDNVINTSLFPTVSILIARIIGWTAGLCSVLAFMPQVIKTLKTKKTRGLSLGMYSFYITGNICWILWALFDLISAAVLGYHGTQLMQSILGDITIIVPNIIATITTSIIIYIKISNIAKHKDYGGKMWQFISTHRHFRRQKKITINN